MTGEQLAPSTSASRQKKIDRDKWNIVALFMWKVQVLSDVDSRSTGTGAFYV